MVRAFLSDPAVHSAQSPDDDKDQIISHLQEEVSQLRRRLLLNHSHSQ